MRNHPRAKTRSFAQRYALLLMIGGGVLAAALCGYFISAFLFADVSFSRAASAAVGRTVAAPQLDRARYDNLIRYLAHTPATPATTTATTTARAATTTKPLWPVDAPYPLYGARLPFERIIAFYGNFYSKQMGVLGQYPEDEMLAKLASTTAAWQAADPALKAVPAIDYIAITAQADAGSDGMYRARMPGKEIDRAIALGRKIGGITILDIQVGKSTLPQELPLLRKYLAQPDVHLAIDPEFAMKKSAPGTVIGYFEATDVNYAAQFLAQLVREEHLPPKILIVHRFTEDMVRHADRITPLPEVQIVMDMDGWGNKARKLATYNQIIAPEPVQFTGFKLFYKNDIQPPEKRLMTMPEVLQLTPAPSFIQYQ